MENRESGPRESSTQRSLGPLWIVLAWTGVALVNAMQSVVGMRAEGVTRPLSGFFIQSTLSWLVWACATPLVVRLARRFPPGGSGWQGWAVHLFGAAAMGWLRASWDVLLLLVIQPWGPQVPVQPFWSNTASRFRNGFLPQAIIYVAILAIVYTVDSRRRLAQQEAELTRSRLDALRRQLEPHFLFNTMNAIAGLVRDRRNDAAVGMIAGLSDLLRRVLDDSDRQEIPLKEELEYIERYLDIQKIRFDPRMTGRIEVPPELYTAPVPTLILQPLVENAIRHGIGKRIEPAEIIITASRAGDRLTISVYNDGPALAVGWTPGVGISNTRARLEALYGSQCAFDIGNRNGGVEAKVTVPCRTLV